MRKISLLALSMVFLLSACAPNFQKQNETVQTKEKTTGKAIIPKYNISNNYYRTILPFEPGEARGLVVNNINTRYDLNEFEMGLMRIAQNSFDTDKYYFQEGQQIKAATIKQWLSRQYTAAQLKEKQIKAADNIGLNPVNTSPAGSTPSSPVYLAHILEHDYLTKDDKGNVSLAGITIGLALNSIYYYKLQSDGDTLEKKIPFSEMEQEGKKMAAEVVKRIRSMKNLGNIPITIALFEQQSKTSVVPGNFFTYSTVDQGSSDLNSWEKVDEKYYLFPSTDAENDHRDDTIAFLNFKQDVEEYFPNYNGVIGKAFYVGDQLQDLSITIPIQFYGKTEGIGFTQYVTGLVMEHFPKYLSVSVSVTSVDGPEALIVKKADATEPFVYIYQ
ncbi:protein involved in sex pheromone biosynthesis [Neobacillus bataviensis]|uniref:Protein involved in sex pheromone biosynthesis n=1 Tax=Neobacillus bataviensis TaxID=220685 RepID=A0A561CX82_9BACI|nr:CamS family sex pheromone protein [Neobacillus bataviensis]TWD95662.1 protein involved in sex pheromone biosynthesis [Neobacillus bataviensis]